MLSDYFKCYKSPSTLAKSASYYTTGVNGGLVIWSKMRFDKMRFTRRGYGENRADILEHLTSPDKAVILQVSNGAHWVTALRKAYLVDDYVILDPWDGKKKLAKKAYGNVSGYATFARY